MARQGAMSMLGNGLTAAAHHEDALSVKEAMLSMVRRIGASETNILAVQANLAMTYEKLGRVDEALRVRQEVYSGRLKLLGEEHPQTLSSANNYALSLGRLERFEEIKALLRKTIPVARRVLGDNDRLTFQMRKTYAQSLYRDADATLDDLHEAVTALQETERVAKRVLGGAHPDVAGIDVCLRSARAALRARETPST